MSRWTKWLKYLLTGHPYPRRAAAAATDTPTAADPTAADPNDTLDEDPEIFPVLIGPALEQRTARTHYEAQVLCASLAMQGYVASARYNDADGLWHIHVQEGPNAR